MSEFDFTKVQKDVCDTVKDKPDPIKEICPTCKPDPSYIEPDWTKKIEEPYLNKKTCEYMVTVTINNEGNAFRAQDFRNYPIGTKRNKLLQSFVQPGLIIMLDYFGKIVSEQIICAHFETEMDFGLTTSGENLKGPAYQSFKSAYDNLLKKPLNVIKDVTKKTATGALKGAAIGGAIGAQAGAVIGASRGVIDNIGEIADPTRQINPTAVTDAAKNIQEGVSKTMDNAINFIKGTPETKFKPCKEYDPQGFTVTPPEEGQPYNIESTIEEIKNSAPTISNPYALEIYARPKEFYIDPTQNLLKVLIAIPASIFDSVPALKTQFELENEAASLRKEVELDVAKLFGQITRLKFAFMTYGKYQSHFYQTQNGFLKIKNPSGGQQEENEDGEMIIIDSYYDYYASTYSKKINKFYDALRELSKANGYNIRSNVKSITKKNAYKIKIIFDDSDPENPYNLGKIKAKRRGCEYEEYTKQLSDITKFFNDQTLMSYIAKIDQMDLELRARKSTPWLDYLLKYTYPVLTISYGDLNPENVEKTAGACVADNARNFSLSLRDYALNELLSLRDLMSYQYSSKNCSTLGDYSGEPEVVEFEGVEAAKDNLEASRSAAQAAKRKEDESFQKTLEPKQEKLESKTQLLKTLNSKKKSKLSRLESLKPKIAPVVSELGIVINGIPIEAIDPIIAENFRQGLISPDEAYDQGLHRLNNHTNNVIGDGIAASETPSNLSGVRQGATDEIRSEIESLEAELESINQEISSTQQQINSLSEDIEFLKSKQAKRALRNLKREAARKARKEARKQKKTNPYVLKARKLASEEILAQDNLLNSLYDFSTFQETGLKGVKANDFTDIELKDIMRRATLCNIKSVVKMAIRCLFSGVTEEAALKKIVKSAMDAMDIDVFGYFVAGLPVDKQSELKKEFQKQFGNLPLPWETGYDPGSIDETNPYVKKLKSPRLQLGDNQVEPSSYSKEEYESDLEARSALMAGLELTNTELLLLAQAKREEELAQASTSSEEEDLPTTDTDASQVEFEGMESAGVETLMDIVGRSGIRRDTTAQKIERFEEQKQRTVNEIEQLNSKISTYKPDNMINRGIAKLDNAVKNLSEAEFQDASDPIRLKLGGDPDKLGSPGTYGTALGNMQKLITDAYIELIMEMFRVEELLEHVERFPGGSFITRLVSDFACSTQGMFKPPLKGFMGTLSLNVCGDEPSIGITLPELKKLPNFDSSGDLVNRLNKIFVQKIENVITQVIKRIFVKIFQTIEAALCKSINAAGTSLASLTSPDGFDDAMRDAFCPDADDKDLNDIKDNLLKNAGVQGASPDAYECLYKALNATLSKGEFLDLLTNNPSQMNSEVTKRIAEIVNAFCPEFSHVLGDQDQVADVFGSMNKFVPPELRQFLRNQAPQLQSEPIYSAICLTREQFDRWNLDRSKILQDAGLDKPTAEKMINDANDRVLNDLGNLADILNKGPTGLLEDALDALMQPPDPTCDTSNSALVFEDDEQIEDALGNFTDYFRLLEKAFYRDLIGRPRSLFNNILVDTNNVRLGLHELFTNLPILFPNYVNSEEDWDFRKDNGSKIYTWAMEKRRMKGMYPDTVGIWMHKKLTESKLTFVTKQIPYESEGEPSITLEFIDNGSGDGEKEAEYKFTTEMTFLRKDENSKKIVVHETYMGKLTRKQKKKLGLEDLGDSEIRLENSTNVVSNDDSLVSKINNFDYSIYKMNNTFQAVAFKSFLDSKVGDNIQINGNINQSFDELNSTLLNFVRDSVLYDENRNIPTGFNFGYDQAQAVTFIDLLYVDPDADPNDKSTWKYTHGLFDKVLGKSATENPRVHFLDPAVHGGNYILPKIYVEPATYNGWLGMVKVFLPEAEDCPDPEVDKGFLNVSEIAKRAKDVESNWPFDERLSIPESCVTEYAFDKIAPPASLGILEGVVMAHMRIYATQFVLKSLPVFASIEFSPRNIDDLFSKMFMDEMKKEMITQTTPWNIVQGYVYYLLFLEQAVQTVQRQVKEGLFEETPELKKLFAQINKAMKSQDPTDIESNMRGAAIIGFGEEGIGLLDTLNKIEKAGVITNMGILTPFKVKMCSKIDTIQRNLATAEKITSLLLQKEVANIASKISLNMRPRPHVQNIRKYLLSRNGILFGSSLRSGEMKLENPVLSGQSGLDYGDVLNVVKDPASENSLDGYSYVVRNKNFILPPGQRIGEYLTQDMPEPDVQARDLLTRQGRREAIREIRTFVTETLPEFFLDKIKKRISIGTSGVFYLEKYVRVINKQGQEQVYNIEEFQDDLKSRTDLDRSLKISDVFGNASPTQTLTGPPTEEQMNKGEYDGTIGIKFGVRLIYAPPENFRFDIPEGKLKERTYSLPTPKLKVRLSEEILCEILRFVPDFITDFLTQSIGEFDLEVPCLSRAIPVVTYEHDLKDRKISELLSDFEKKNMGEDLKCYVDKLTEQEDFEMLFGQFFPVKSYVSLFGVYSYYAFFASIGQDGDERDEDSRGLANDRWRSDVLKRSKKTLRQLFNGAYRTDKEVKKERNRAKRDVDAQFLKNLVPDAYFNLDASIRWWQLFRVVGSRPFDADGKDCKNEFQKLFS